MKYIKGLLTYKGNTYWLNMGWLGGKDDEKFTCQILDNGKWRKAKKTEVDLFDLIEQGEIIGTEKQP